MSIISRPQVVYIRGSHMKYMWNDKNIFFNVCYCSVLLLAVWQCCSTGVRTTCFSYGKRPKLSSLIPSEVLTSNLIMLVGTTAIPELVVCPVGVIYVDIFQFVWHGTLPKWLGQFSRSVHQTTRRGNRKCFSGVLFIL